MKINPWVQYFTVVAGITVLTAAAAFLQVFPRIWGHQYFSILIGTTYFLMRPLERLLNIVFRHTQLDFVFWVLIVVCHFLVAAVLLIPLLLFFCTGRRSFVLAQVIVLAAYVIFAVVVVAPWVKGW